MGQWHKTGCVLCAQNCGLEVLVENNRIIRSRPDKDNVRSEGYCCRKGLNVAWHQHHADRLTHPLKKVNGGFERISWDQAIDEIAEKLGGIVKQHGPRSLAYMGGGGQGCHFEAAFGVRLLRGLGSHYHYSALGQELTGHFWVHGRVVGRQNLFTGPDDHNADLLLCLGWNPWMSHQMPQARRVVNRFQKDPSKKLVVVDPRRSETAARADIHLQIRPGTDALLLKAMISIILNEGLEDREYIAAHVSGLDQVLDWLKGFDAKEALKVCELDYEEVREMTRLFATMKSCLHGDLGLLMGRHSTITSYLQMILLAICGRLCVPGGNVIAGSLMPLGAHSDERDPKTWRTVATGFPAITGVFPPNVVPEEIMTEGPDRLRAVLVSGSNPLISYADTSKYEEAFAKLDLLVTNEVAMTETARLSHYVLPARTGYESWDGTFFPMTYPNIFFQMRRPVVEPEGEPLECGEIMTRLADKLGLIPELPDSLYEAAQKDRLTYGLALMEFFKANPEAANNAPFILAKTLGPVLGSGNLAALWGLLMTAPKSFQENAARVGFTPGLTLGEEIFQAILDRPEGLWIGGLDPEDNLGQVRTEDGRVNVYIEELADETRNITPASEAEALVLDEKYPFILMAGRHMDYNANSVMRDPAWNKDFRACTVAVHPDDAASLGLVDGESVKVLTEAGSGIGELEVTDSARPGHVVIPHGFGMIHDGKTYGINVNRLTKNTHRDHLAGTPLHRYVPCRLEAV